ncbi:MAG TPA: ribosome small subunit-dependent GTPase A [Steroidobacteraceae bacterium]|jgi:ribosome biogenesis GTPase|nr:ribosome small subunit-dependent GTPase A [Steroidobacteraceae bacterium]
MVAERREEHGFPHGTGVVIASFGRRALVGTDGGALLCGLQGRHHRVVCGDRVAWGQPSAADAPMISALEPRRNLIERIDSRGRPEPVAANIDQLAIVAAAEPAPDWYLVDRYWAGAVLKDVDCLLVVNKADLDMHGLDGEIAGYTSLNLRSVRTSTSTGAGIAALAAALRGRTTLIVGQSGVGKSSMVNALSPEAAAKTAELTREIEGRHTTTTARRYDLDGATAVMDAPGVRDFAPPANLLRAAERGFVEVLARSSKCRFKDCRHMEEPGCAVRTAVVAGEIAARRYESYRRLFRLYEKLASQS